MGGSWSCRHTGVSAGDISAVSAVPGRPRPQPVEPLSPGRYRVQFTVSADLRDKLERLSSSPEHPQSPR
jgi:hypothetical protein